MWSTLLGGLHGVVAASASAGATEDLSKLLADGIPDAAPVAEPSIPGFDGKLPTPQQLLEALESMTGLSDDERTQLKEDLLKNIQGRASHAQAAIAGGDLTTQTIVLLALLSIVGLVFVFFVYKLIKLLSEREAKREEKRKSKQLKKKK